MSTRLEKVLIQIQAQASCSSLLSDSGAREVLEIVDHEVQYLLKGIENNQISVYENYPTKEEKQNDA